MSPWFGSDGVHYDRGFDSRQGCEDLIGSLVVEASTCSRVELVSDFEGLVTPFLEQEGPLLMYICVITSRRTIARQYQVYVEDILLCNFAFQT
jgi:hypothetical protein